MKEEIWTQIHLETIRINSSAAIIEQDKFKKRWSLSCFLTQCGIYLVAFLSVLLLVVMMGQFF